MFVDRTLSFYILNNDLSQQADLTERYCAYFSYLVNNDTENIFVKNVIDIDTAINNCETPYLIIVSPGFTFSSIDFFNELFGIINNQIFVGEIIPDDDFAFVSSKFLCINLELWRKFGSPKFISNIKQSYKLVFDSYIAGDKLPTAVKNKYVERTVFLTPEYSSRGAELIDTALNNIGKFQTLNSINEKHYFYLDTSSAYSELFTETKFEKIYLNNIKEKCNINFESIPERPVDLLVSPAEGLRSLFLAQNLNVKAVVVFSKNENELNLQKQIFSIVEPQLFSEVLESYSEKYSTNFSEEFETYRNYVLTPFKGQAEFVKCDLFSFEFPELIKRLDTNQAAMFDFSSLFIYPNYFYKRPLYQVEALFTEIYSLIKSRNGPSFLSGLGPNFINLSSIDVNTVDMRTIIKEDNNDMFKVESVAKKPKVEKIKKGNLFKKLSKVSKNKILAINSNNEVMRLLIDRGYDLNESSNDHVILLKNEIIADIKLQFTYKLDIKTDSWIFSINKKDSNQIIEFNRGTGLGDLNAPFTVSDKIVLEYFS